MKRGKSIVVALYGFHTGVGLSTTVTSAFCRGAGAQLLHISDYLENGLPPDTSAVAFYGILRGTGLLYRDAVARGIDFYYLDHGYFQKSWHRFSWFGKKHAWFRVCGNGHTLAELKAVSPNRFNRYFADEYRLDSWRGGTGKSILVLPPTPAIKWLFGSEYWSVMIAKRIRSLSKLPIVWREKPGSKCVDAQGFPDGTLAIPDLPRVNDLIVSDRSLAEDLAEAAVVVCYNSNVAVEAVRLGIPVICEEHCPAFSISFPIESLADTDRFRQEPDRRRWFQSLAWGQFSMTELQSGFAGRHLRLNNGR